MLMAMAQRVGGFCAAFVVVPLCGALTVWLTYALGQQLFGKSVISLSAAALVGTSPIFLYQLMNPMSDVPVAALWAAAVVLAMADWTLLAGVAAGAALMVRPNLVAVAVALSVWLALTQRRPVRFLVGLVPFGAAVAAINASVYESAFVSGYGTLRELYAWSYWSTNGRQFAMWTASTQTPVVLLAAVYFVAPGWFPPARVPYPRLLLLAVAGAVKASYLFYLPFDAWWYLRFLLPIWPLMMVLTAAAIVAVAERLTRAAASVVLVSAALALAIYGVRVAAQRYAFDIARAERRYIDVARFVDSHTDRRAVVLAVQHSGTIRLYAGRLTLRFDQLDPEWLDRAVDFLSGVGRHPYVVLEAGEKGLFTSRFAGRTASLVGGTPLARLEDADVSVYDALAGTVGEPLAIADAASRKTGWRCDVPPVWPPPRRIE